MGASPDGLAVDPSEADDPYGLVEIKCPARAETPKASKSPPWWTKSISVAIKAKHSAFSRYRRSRSCADYANYKTKRNIVKCKLRTAQK